MIPQDVPNDWASDSILNKAQVYAEVMLSFPRDDWKFALWSTLTLELLARASLATISPALVADIGSSRQHTWHNLLYSLNIQPNSTNFVPRSIDISEVFRRLQELVPNFTPELRDYCIGHLNRRNSELHSGATPFVGVGLNSWIPDYYRSCAALLEFMNDSLDRFFGSSEAQFARTVIAASQDESAKSIRRAIEAHKTVWESNSDGDKEVLIRQSSTWATRQLGHRVQCPACKCVAILTGAATAPPTKTITEDEITEKQEFLPARFECVACSLKISGLSQLSAAGLGDPYYATFTYDANEYYASYPDDDEYEGYEPDFNDF